MKHLSIAYIVAACAALTTAARMENGMKPWYDWSGTTCKLEPVNETLDEPCIGTQYTCRLGFEQFGYQSPEDCFADRNPNPGRGSSAAANDALSKEFTITTDDNAILAELAQELKSLKSKSRNAMNIIPRRFLAVSMATDKLDPFITTEVTHRQSL
ncbi:hypothetical protein HRG_004162 [Hirsutella rhossiliensis]|uniref:Uncharacterized protein n=1 Tax=Hirsutella rhossiliensis TaxID=111463 RepID=A0A9P8N572_9HYPO|nr:uncharacterized protein HRG_04162 [Hirsutella rhossiliensis]KAH0966146.1 hypothetical protein HRG_04162 [Hirsutella rhossiliensis]